MKPSTDGTSQLYTITLLDRRWLTDDTFELTLSRPEGFMFTPGQHIRLVHKNIERDYSLISTPEDPKLSLCIQEVKGGKISSLLAQAELETPWTMRGPYGYFLFRPSKQPAIFVATGTGIAPFVSMARVGETRFTLLQGAGQAQALYYREVFENTIQNYIPCLSRDPSSYQGTAQAFPGRVTRYLTEQLKPAAYDFYLCGGTEMIGDVMRIVDANFPGSRVYTEIFY